jgi:hypothetical protein
LVVGIATPDRRDFSIPASAAEKARCDSSSLLVTVTSVTVREITDRAIIRETEITKTTTRSVCPEFDFGLGRIFIYNISLAIF